MIFSRSRGHSEDDDKMVFVGGYATDVDGGFQSKFSTLILELEPAW